MSSMKRKRIRLSEYPSSKGKNGRDQRTGRFQKGWRGGPGNPHAKKVARLRSVLLNAVTPEDVEEVIAALLRKAKRGDVYAARELFDRLMGRPQQTDTREPDEIAVAGLVLLRRLVLEAVHLDHSTKSDESILGVDMRDLRTRLLELQNEN